MLISDITSLLQRITSVYKERQTHEMLTEFKLFQLELMRRAAKSFEPGNISLFDLLDMAELAIQGKIDDFQVKTMLQNVRWCSSRANWCICMVNSPTLDYLGMINTITMVVTGMEVKIYRDHDSTEIALNVSLVGPELITDWVGAELTNFINRWGI